MSCVALWIIGRGGLLGSAVSAAAQRDGRFREWQPAGAFTWADGAALRAECARAAGAFLTFAGGSPWAVLWAAGIGVVGSPQETLAGDTQALSYFLEALSEAKKTHSCAEGTVAIASSAGAVYGPASHPLSEGSPTRPVSAYGREKLRQEELLKAWAATEKCRGLALRFSNLYGARQRPGKAQGFLSRLSKCLIHRTPLHLFVPLATVRDYLHVDDAAASTLASLRAMRSHDKAWAVKIVASGRTTTLAEVIGTFALVAKRRPLLVSAPSPVAAQHPGAVSFRSALWPEADPPPRTLPAGVAELHAHHLSLHRQGRLPSAG